MEIFQKALVVRLRSYHDKYLLADDDQETVYQDRNGTHKSAKWTVEILESGNAIRLKSCYGKYLTASNMPFLLGATGKKVLQTLPRRLDSSLEWEPIREGVQVRLKTRYNQYLRGNGGLPPWRNSITHDVPHRSASRNWVLWDVDVVELRPQAPKISCRPQPITPPERSMNPTPTDRCPSPSPSPSPCVAYSPPSPAYSPSPAAYSPSSLLDPCSFARIELKAPISSDELKGSNDEGSPTKEGRTVFYDVGDENGEVDDANEGKYFTFKGSCVEELTEKLKEETGLSDILVCCRNPLNAKLYPLRLQLPPNNTDIHVILVPSSFKADMKQ